jgi:hypothetical protein
MRITAIDKGDNIVDLFKVGNILIEDSSKMIVIVSVGMPSNENSFCGYILSQGSTNQSEFFMCSHLGKSFTWSLYPHVLHLEND